MKNNLTCLLLALLMTFTWMQVHAASPVVYMPQAKNKPFERYLYVSDSVQTLAYSASLRSTVHPTQDIRVKFGIEPGEVKKYNARNGTNYKLLPAESYQMGETSGIIPAGNVFVWPQTVEVRTKGFVKPFESYLLPISISAEGADVDPELRTVYYVIHGICTPGQNLFKEISRILFPVRSFFGFGGKYLVVQDETGTMRRYVYNSGKGTLDAGIVMDGGTGWQDMAFVLNHNDRRFVALNTVAGNGQLFGYDVDEQCRKIEKPKLFGTSGYNIFNMIISVGRNLYCRKTNSELQLYPLNDDLTWGASGHSGMGGGCGYKAVFAYGKSLVGIDARGDMWQYPLMEDGKVGWKNKIGSGWGRFERIAVLGDDLLALDGEGRLWCCKFNGKALWVLR